MDEKQMELMRALTAAQAALWDVVDNPTAGAQMMLGIMTTRCARLGAGLITRTPKKEN